MPQTFSRRTFAAGGLAVTLAGALPSSGRYAVAQEGGPLSGLDLPTLDVTVTEDGFGGVAQEIEAGRYIVNVTPDEGVEVWGAAFIRPPEGITADQFLLDLEPPTEVQSQDETAPDVTSPGGLFIRTLPPVAYDAMWAGGVVGTPDSDALGQVVVDLEPGEWILWTGDSQAPQTPLIFNVTGEMPGDLTEPETGIQAALSDGTITVDGDLSPGEHVLRVAHDGNEPHHLQMMKVPDGTTEDDVELVLRASAQDDPETDELPFDPETDVHYTLITAELSGGAVMWAPVSIDAGTYILHCFLPDREDNTPHALEGEYALVTVE